MNPFAIMAKLNLELLGKKDEAFYRVATRSQLEGSEEGSLT